MKNNIISKLDKILGWTFELWLKSLYFVGTWLMPIVDIDLWFFHYGLIDSIPVTLYLYFEIFMINFIMILIVLYHILNVILD